MARIVTGAYMRGFVIPRRRKRADEESPSLCRAFVILSGAMRSVAPVGTSIARPGIDAKAPRKKAKRNPRFRLRTFPITRPLPSGSFDSGFAFAQDDSVCSRLLAVWDPSGFALRMTGAGAPANFTAGKAGNFTVSPSGETTPSLSARLSQGPLPDRAGTAGAPC